MTTILEEFGSWALEMSSLAPEGVPKRAKTEVTTQVQLAIGPYLLVTLPPQGLYPARDLRDLTPSERRAIWRAKLEEYRRQKKAQKKKGKDTGKIEARILAMKRRLEDEEEA